MIPGRALMHFSASGDIPLPLAAFPRPGGIPPPRRPDQIGQATPLRTWQS